LAWVNPHFRTRSIARKCSASLFSSFDDDYDEEEDASMILGKEETALGVQD
jgi:hypothetical protein